MQRTRPQSDSRPGTRPTRKAHRAMTLALAALQIFVGLGGAAGGLSMLLDPVDGRWLHLPLAWLTRTPFTTYLIPGLFLFVGNGLAHLAGGVLSAARHRRAGDAALVLGAYLTLWIVIQVAWIGYVSELQPAYFILGAAEIALALAVRRASHPG